MKRVVLLDDHVFLLKPISDYIKNNSDFEIVGEYSCGDEFIDDYKNKDLDFEFVAADLMMENGDGYSILEFVKNMNPDIKVIIMTFQKQPGLLESVLKSGANGIINKTSNAKELLNALIETSNNKEYLCPEIERILNDKRDKVKKQEEVKALTKREREILLLICKDELKDREIADKLHIAETTVKAHRSNINTKLKVDSGVKLVRAAVDLGYLNIGK